MKKAGVIIICLITVAFMVMEVSCKKESAVEHAIIQHGDIYNPTPFNLKLPLWALSNPPTMPVDNPLTVEGVSLGRKLFYDKILSANLTMACATCHNLGNGFTDNAKQFSTGIDNFTGNRNSMPVFNLLWVERYAKAPYRFFWDGRATDLEDQAKGPISNPIEMHDSMPHVTQKLQADPDYPGLFKKAFGTSVITPLLVQKAIAQFERTIISANAKIDKYLVNVDPNTGHIIGTKDPSVFSEQELRGYYLFNDTAKGDCFHCHNINGPFSTDFLFHHNGHQSADQGLMTITGNSFDQGKFRTPTLRNLVFTAPYMHDGRFATLEEVVEFYNSQAIRTFPADPFITKHPTGLNMTSQDKADLVVFLKTLSDSSFITNPDYMKP